MQLEDLEGQEQSELRMAALQLKKGLRAREMDGEGETAAYQKKTFGGIHLDGFLQPLKRKRWTGDTKKRTMRRYLDPWSRKATNRSCGTLLSDLLMATERVTPAKSSKFFTLAHSSQQSLQPPESTPLIILRDTATHHHSDLYLHP